ncbi:MAG TPA: methionyl-tRNA formyltransferase [Chloroflexia bacterium]|nr:methionyl-tRNA formyltransferase [Chloroflexia bacterium]
MARMIFMGTPAFAEPALRRLAAAGYDLTVVTQPDRPGRRSSAPIAPPVKVLAQALGLLVEQPPTLRDPAVVDRIRDLAPDLIVVVAYGEILRPAVLDLPRHGCVNLHPSLLPRWRGPTPINAAIREGDTTTGVSVIRMDRGMDSGPLLAQEQAPVRPTDTAATLGARLAEQGAALLATTVARVLAGTITAWPQAEAEAKTCRLLHTADGQIDWRDEAAAIERQVRAYDPWPGTFTIWQGRRLKVLATRLLPVAAGPDRPGWVQRVRDLDPPAAEGARRLAVRCGDGWLELLHVQLEGKPATASDLLLSGYPAIVDSTLTRQE